MCKALYFFAVIFHCLDLSRFEITSILEKQMWQIFTELTSKFPLLTKTYPDKQSSLSWHCKAETHIPTLGEKEEKEEKKEEGRNHKPQLSMGLAFRSSSCIYAAAFITLYRSWANNFSNNIQKPPTLPQRACPLQKPQLTREFALVKTLNTEHSGLVSRWPRSQRCEAWLAQHLPGRPRVSQSCRCTSEHLI